MSPTAYDAIVLKQMASERIAYQRSLMRKHAQLHKLGHQTLRAMIRIARENRRVAALFPSSRS